MPMDAGRTLQKLKEMAQCINCDRAAAVCDGRVHHGFYVIFEMPFLIISNAKKRLGRTWQYGGLSNVCPVSPISPDLAMGLPIQSNLCCRGSI